LQAKGKSLKELQICLTSLERSSSSGTSREIVERISQSPRNPIFAHPFNRFAAPSHILFYASPAALRELRRTGVMYIVPRSNRLSRNNFRHLSTAADLLWRNSNSPLSCPASTKSAVGICVEKAVRTMRELGIAGEVVIVDNGSSDRSVEIATQAGAWVVYHPLKGYGNALRRGFPSARTSSSSWAIATTATLYRPEAVSSIVSVRAPDVVMAAASKPKSNRARALAAQVCATRS
jgi:hypothetical protein